MYLQQYVDRLTYKYCNGVTVTLSTDKKTAMTVNGEIPLLPHRIQRRFAEMKNLMNDGSVKEVSTYRAAYAGKRADDLFEIAKNEFDLCEYLLSDRITEICAFGSGINVNAIAKTAEGLICTFELSTVLDKDEEPIDKHEIIARKGVVCDIVVDTQVHQSSIYIFGKNRNTYTDTDFELYGLSNPDIHVVRQ